MENRLNDIRLGSFNLKFPVEILALGFDPDIELKQKYSLIDPASFIENGYLINNILTISLAY